MRVVRARGGRQHLVHVAERGATMGEVSIFGGEAYPATAIAATECRCLVLAAEAVRAVAERNPAVAVHLLERVTRRLAGLVDRLEGQTLGDVRARLAASLVGMAAAAPDGVAVVPGTRAEWAEDLGTVREVLTRELKRLAEAGAVEPLGVRRFRIVDEERVDGWALGRP